MKVTLMSGRTIINIEEEDFYLTLKGKTNAE